MSLTPPSEIRNVTDISDHENQRIRDFLQGAVYCWCKNRNDEWFALRYLMGGPNFDWSATPLNVLYEKHLNRGKNEDQAVEDAGKDCGWLVKSVINDDDRQFETITEEQTRKYR
jgi:hypothetical protein